MQLWHPLMWSFLRVPHVVTTPWAAASPCSCAGAGKAGPHSWQLAGEVLGLQKGRTSRRGLSSWVGNSGGFMASTTTGWWFQRKTMELSGRSSSSSKGWQLTVRMFETTTQKRTSYWRVVHRGGFMAWLVTSSKTCEWSCFSRKKYTEPYWYRLKNWCTIFAVYMVTSLLASCGEWSPWRPNERGVNRMRDLMQTCSKVRNGNGTTKVNSWQN